MLNANFNHWPSLLAEKNNFEMKHLFLKSYVRLTFKYVPDLTNCTQTSDIEQEWVSDWGFTDFEQDLHFLNTGGFL